MRGRHHHARDGFFLADGITHFGRRPQVVEQIDIDAVGGKHVRRNLGKLAAVVAAVVRDAYAQFTAAMLFDVVGQSLGCHTHGVFVHPVGAYAHNAAQTARTEFQTAVEGILQTDGVFPLHPADFFFRLFVEVAVQPSLDRL